MHNSPEEHLKCLVKEYLDAFETRDLERCISYIAPDTTIHFMEGIFQGEEAIRQWHKDRFEADMRIQEIEDIQIQADTVTVNAVIRSNRLRTWNIPHLTGYARAKVHNGKIKELSFGLIGLYATNPAED